MRICRRMNRIIRLGLLTAVLLAACQSQTTGGPIMNECTVYPAVLRSKTPRPIVINSTVDTFGEVSSGKLPELILGIRGDTIDSWVDRNGESVSLPKNLSFQKGYEVVAQSEVDTSASYYSFSR